MLNNAIINLRTLKYNAKLIKNRLKGKAKLCAVVKADAYGHGAEMCANALLGIADYFAVCLVEEGIKLRLSGINTDILVLIPIGEKDIEDALNYNLTLSVCDLLTVRKIARLAKKKDRIAKIHIKYNTGMNRQGIDDLEALEEIFKFAKTHKSLCIEGIYSHLAMPQNTKLLEKAKSRFFPAVTLAKKYNKNIIAHISASGGFIRGEYFDMVRIGILLYGYLPFKSADIKVKPIMKVYAPVIKTRTIKRGESALYGNEKSKKTTELKLVRYGYADGLMRRKVKGQFNNRCMDVTAVSEVAKKGQINVIENAENLAEELNTITYEILCKSTIRAEKIYLN